MNAWFSIPMSIYCVVFELAVCYLTAVFISPLCFVQQIRSSLSSEQNHGLLIATGSWYYLVYWRDSGPWLGLPFNKPVFWDAIARIPSLQDVDINLIRDCNEMLQRDLEKYEEMVSHWSGASDQTCPAWGMGEFWGAPPLKLGGIDVSWPRKLIEVSDFSIEPPILIHFGGQSCWIMLRARFGFYSDICWVHIGRALLMLNSYGEFWGCVPQI